MKTPRILSSGYYSTGRQAKQERPTCWPFPVALCRMRVSPSKVSTGLSTSKKCGTHFRESHQWRDICKDTCVADVSQRSDTTCRGSRVNAQSTSFSRIASSQAPDPPSEHTGDIRILQPRRCVRSRRRNAKASAPAVASSLGTTVFFPSRGEG